MTYNRNDLPYGDGTINETIEVTAPGWHGKAKHLEILPHDPLTQWTYGTALTALLNEPTQQQAGNYDKPPKMEIVDTYGEQSYIGWWFRQHWQKLAKAYGVAVIARRLKKQGVPLHVSLMILTGKVSHEDA